ncbi:MAG: MarR family transcriptional regulator [Spirosomataceae bacterium]
MSIEHDIKQQKPFRSPYQRMVVNISYTANWLNANLAEILKPYDLSIQQYNVLRILRGQHPNPTTVNAIIERMLDKQSNASRLIDKLLSKELVSRRICPADRRAVDIVITPKGLEVLADIDELNVQWEKQLEGISTDEANVLSQLLDKIRKSDETDV